MKHVELHILQSFPVSCLNRDDLNSPKTAIFGGVQRARVSSQCWKRAIREYAQKECNSNLFKGQRGRYIINPLQVELQKLDFPEKESKEIALKIGEALATKDTESRVKTAFFTSPKEINKIAKAYKKTNDIKKVIKELEAEDLLDAADISLFGRMVANEPSLTLEGAAMFSHALSTHKVENDIDFFSAVEDFPTDEPGAAHTSTLEFNSATYYRFSAVNLDILFDENHLELLSPEEQKNILKDFIKSTIEAIPVARKNSMNANTRPFVLCVVRKKGHPIQLINAFETAITIEKGKSIFEISKEKLMEEYKCLKGTWNLKGKEFIIPLKVGTTENDGKQEDKYLDVDTFLNQVVDEALSDKKEESDGK